MIGSEREAWIELSKRFEGMKKERRPTMWIRINDFIINLDNVTNINIAKEYVYISFCHGITEVRQEGNEDIYWNSLAFKKEDIPKKVLGIFHGLTV